MIVFVLTIAVPLSAFFVYFGSALSQEAHTPNILQSIFTLHVSNGDFKQVHSDESRYQYVSRYEPKTDYELIKRFMSEKGWAFKEQMGAGLFFEKNSVRTVITTKLYTGRYMLWNVEKDVVEGS